MAWITDSLRSAIARISPFGRGNDILPSVFNHQMALAAYMSSGMLRKVIAIPAEDRVREWRDWQADSDQIEALEAEERRLQLIAKIEFAENLRGIGGGAMILITAGDHAQPLTPDTIRKGGLVAVNVVSRWQIQGADWVTDLSDPAYGTPRMFQISGDGANRKIHPSRVICFRGKPIPAGAAVSMEDAFWGDCRLLRVFTEVQRSDQTQAWFSALVKKAKLLRIGIPNLSDMASTQDGKDALDSRVALIAEGENSLNAVVYDAGDGTDKSGEKISDYQITWAGIPAIMDAFDQRVAAVSDIPFTRLMGRSPAGMNATGKHDMDNWNRSVVASQKLELRPCLEQLDPVLIRSAGIDPAAVTWRFAPLDTPSEKEEADTFKVTMEAVETLIGTGAIPDLAMTKAVQNLMSEREWMPGMDQALAEIPEAERFGLLPDDDNAEGGDPDLAEEEAGTEARPPRRAANDAAPRTLYVRRDVVNVAELRAWAKAQGLPALQDGLHVTIAYSKTPIDWMKIDGEWNQDAKGEITIQPGGVRIVEPLGDRTAVLLFTSSALTWRHESIVRAGASHDYPDYQPHISLTGEPVDLAGIEPYRGKIVLGPEIFEEIRERD